MTNVPLEDQLQATNLFGSKRDIKGRREKEKEIGRRGKEENGVVLDTNNVGGESQSLISHRKQMRNEYGNIEKKEISRRRTWKRGERTSLGLPAN